MTDSQNDTDAGPTPGPWRLTREHSGAGDLVVEGATSFVATPWRTAKGEDQMLCNARLIAAAGNAAHDLPDGVDPLDAIRALPELIEAARSGSYSAVMDALASAEGSEE
jgi:hypothetical protein